MLPCKQLAAVSCSEGAHVRSYPRRYGPASDAEFLPSIADKTPGRDQADDARQMRHVYLKSYALVTNEERDDGKQRIMDKTRRVVADAVRRNKAGRRSGSASASASSGCRKAAKHLVSLLLRLRLSTLLACTSKKPPSSQSHFSCGGTELGNNSAEFICMCDVLDRCTLNGRFYCGSLVPLLDGIIHQLLLHSIGCCCWISDDAPPHGHGPHPRRHAIGGLHGTRQRHPRLRFGKVHLYNNYTRNWGIYAVCASVEAQIVSQCNIYRGEKKTVFKYMPEKAADREETVAGWIRSEGDAFLNAAQLCLIDGPGVDSVFRPEDYDKWAMEAASPAHKELLQICTGW